MNTSTRPRATKRYKALIAAGLSDTDALGVMGVSEAEAQEVDPRLAGLIHGGFTEEQARKILGDQDAAPKGKKGKKKGKKAKASAAIKAEVAEVVAASMSPKERAEALVAEKGLTFTRGRVYVTPTMIEALARVTKTGKAEIVQASGVGRTTAVLIYKEESGDVAVQNLMKPA
ncbi:MAG: hypothetical protein HOV97_05520 [Nonomuraea sp.]|nr:hypothetical protein [Nonomuraea sp.]